MKTNKAIDYAIIALRYWSEQTEMGKQVCNEATAVLKTLKEDETINVTLELSRDALKKALALSDVKGDKIENLIKVVFDENTEQVTINKEILSNSANSVITSIVKALD